MLSHQAYSREPIQLKNEFNIDKVKWVNFEGNSSVSGEAYIKLENGIYKGCSGFNVELLPVSEYSNERIFFTYGNKEMGQILMSQNPPKFIPDVKEYHEYLIKSKCDIHNEFRFDAVPSGDYYLIALIIFGELPNLKGGGVMKKISVGKASDMSIIVKQ